MLLEALHYLNEIDLQEMQKLLNLEGMIPEQSKPPRDCICVVLQRGTRNPYKYLQAII